MIVHIPHGGLYVPARYSDFVGEPVPLTDIGVRQVFEGGVGDCLVFPVDRLVCDVERFVDGEPMEAKGMGICYTRNVRLEPMREVSPEQRREIIDTLYVPHHRRLKAMVDAEVAKYGRCLIVDGHTFSAVPLPYEDDDLRPEIDVGYDESIELGKETARILSQWYDVSENRPFAGSLRPLDRMGDSRVASVMIEVRQDLDMEKVRSNVQSTMEILEHLWYGNDIRYWNNIESAREEDQDMLTAKERHDILDALANEYRDEPDGVELIYSHWDDASMDERSLENLKAALSVTCVKSEGDWRENLG